MSQRTTYNGSLNDMFNALSSAGVSDNNLRDLVSTFRALEEQNVTVPGLREVNQLTRALGIDESNVVNRYNAYRPSNTIDVNSVAEENLTNALHSDALQQLKDDVSKVDLVLDYRKDKILFSLADEPEFAFFDEHGTKDNFFKKLDGYWAKLERNAKRKQEKTLEASQSSQNNSFSFVDFTWANISLKKILTRHINESEADQIIAAFSHTVLFGQNADGENIRQAFCTLLNDVFISNRSKLGGFAKDLWKWTMWFFCNQMDNRQDGPLSRAYTSGTKTQELAAFMKRELREIEKEHGRMSIDEDEINLNIEKKLNASAPILAEFARLAGEASKLREVVEKAKLDIEKSRLEAEEKAKAEEEAKERARLESEAKAKAEAEAIENARLKEAARVKAEAERQAAEEARKKKEFEDYVQSRVSEKLKNQKQSLASKIKTLKDAIPAKHANYENAKRSDEKKQSEKEINLIRETLSAIIGTIEAHKPALEGRWFIKAETRDAKYKALTHLSMLCELGNLDLLETFTQYIITSAKREINFELGKEFTTADFTSMIYPSLVMYDQGNKGSDTADLINKVDMAIRNLKTQIKREGDDLSQSLGRVKFNLDNEVESDQKKLEKLSLKAAKPENEWRAELEKEVREEIKEEERKERVRQERLERQRHEQVRQEQLRVERERRNAEDRRLEAQRRAVLEEARRREQQEERERQVRRDAKRREEAQRAEHQLALRRQEEVRQAQNQVGFGLFDQGNLEHMRRETAEAHRRAQEDGTFDRMRREMQTDPFFSRERMDRMTRENQEAFRRAQQDGTFDRMHREMKADPFFKKPW